VHRAQSIASAKQRESAGRAETMMAHSTTVQPHASTHDGHFGRRLCDQRLRFMHEGYVQAVSHTAECLLEPSASELRALKGICDYFAAHGIPMSVERYLAIEMGQALPERPAAFLLVAAGCFLPSHDDLEALAQALARNVAQALAHVVWQVELGPDWAPDWAEVAVARGVDSADATDERDDSAGTRESAPLSE
jgi:hypothetical protein